MMRSSLIVVIVLLLIILPLVVLINNDASSLIPSFKTATAATDQQTPQTSQAAAAAPDRKRSRMKMKMDTKEIVPDGGVEMPVMSIGVGGLESHKAYEIVTNWLELGGTGIDTALNYGNQDQVAKAIKDSGVSREDLFLTTKIPDCNVNNVMTNLETDLELLNTTYVDLMLIHGPRRGDCVATWKILEQYYLANKTRAIGVSNFRSQDLQPLLEQQRFQGGGIIPHVNQIKLNLLQKDLDTVNFCAQHGIVIEAYSPLGRGGNQVVSHPVVERLAQAHNVTTYQIALKWILQHGWVLTFQSSSQAHQATDAQVFDFNLTLSEMKELDQVAGIDDSDDSEE